MLFFSDIEAVTTQNTSKKVSLSLTQHNNHSRPTELNIISDYPSTFRAIAWCYEIGGMCNVGKGRNVYLMNHRYALRGISSWKERQHRA